MSELRAILETNYKSSIHHRVGEESSSSTIICCPVKYACEAHRLIDRTAGGSRYRCRARRRCQSSDRDCRKARDKLIHRRSRDSCSNRSPRRMMPDLYPTATVAKQADGIGAPVVRACQRASRHSFVRLVMCRRDGVSVDLTRKTRSSRPTGRSVHC